MQLNIGFIYKEDQNGNEVTTHGAAGLSALASDVDLKDISAVVNALPNGQKQFTDYFFYVEGQATTDDGFYQSDTLRVPFGLMRKKR